jgi:hypothetical protein
MMVSFTATGTLAGGWIPKRLRMTTLQQSTMTVIVSALSVAGMFCLLAYCDTPALAGVSVP